MSSTDKARDLLEHLSQQVEQLTSSVAWANYLDMQARFHRYSWNNVLLIQSQLPSATQVAGFHAWKDLGRSVVKGAKAIKILAPRTVKVTDETGEVQRKVVGFGVVNVFDVSQTEGAELPEVVQLLSGGGTTELMSSLLAFADSKNLAVEFGDAQGANGFFDRSPMRIVVSDSLAEAQQTKTLAHEIGHALLHADPEIDMSREDKELEAESVAYIVCKHYGLDTSDYSLGYIACWQAADEERMKAFRQSAQRIQRAAAQVIDWIDKDLGHGSESARDDLVPGEVLHAAADDSRSHARAVPAA